MKILYKVYHRFVSPHIECARLYKLDLSKYLAKWATVNNTDFSFILPGKEAMSAFAEIYQQSEKKMETIHNRFDSGNYTCFAYQDTSNGRLAYTRWVCKKNFYSDTLRRELTFKEDEVLTLDSWTHPDYRGLGLHRNMNIEMLNWLKENTQTKSVFMVIKCFIPHLTKIPMDLGYKPIQTYIHLK